MVLVEADATTVVAVAAKKPNLEAEEDVNPTNF